MTHMIHLIHYLGSAILDYMIFLKTEINTIQNVHEYKNSWISKIWLRKLEKLSQKSWLVRPTWNLMIAMETSKKMDTQLAYQTFRWE